MKAKLEIKDNQVFLVRLLFFKTLIGKYSDGMIIFNKQYQELLKKDNKPMVNILRKTF